MTTVPVGHQYHPQMKPLRQIEAVELMSAMSNFIARYAQALLAATRREDLAQPDRPKKIRGLSAEQMARMEREMDGLQREFKAVSPSYGDTVLNLVVAAGYVSSLIGNRRLSSYLERRHPEILTEFKAIAFRIIGLSASSAIVARGPCLYPGLDPEQATRRLGCRLERP
jgi:hypothetical protein